MDDDERNDACQALHLVRRRLKELKYQEDWLMTRIYELMDEDNTNVIETPFFKASRNIQTRTTLPKSVVPEDFWEENAVSTPFWVLRITPH